MEKIRDIFNKLLDFIYKKRCYFCGSSKECFKMCSKCYGELVFSDPRPNRILEGVKIYSAGVYEKYIQKMIRGMKYHNQKELAYYMAKFMWEYWEETGENKKFIIIPVPLHEKRKRKRGYNHMELVARELSFLSGFDINTNLIKRVKNTKPQYKLSYAEKLKNMENAFSVNVDEINNEPILIIDDICTSGATLGSMIRELKSKGTDDITCLCTSSPR